MHSFKIISLVVLLIVAITIAGNISQKYLSATSKELESIIIKIEEYTNREDWSSAEAMVDEIEIVWSEHERVWASIIDHAEIDNIDTAMARLTTFIQTREKPSAVAEAATMKKYIQHIPVKDAPIWKNIL